MILLALALAATGGREAIGVSGTWGAFRERSPHRCFALAVPARTGARGPRRPFASIAYWPDRHRRDVLFIQLSAPRDPGSPVTLSVGDRRFRLIGSAAAAWSPDPATDHAVVAALRGERSFSIAAVSVDGKPFADTYALAGAATAADAAALACRAPDAVRP